MSGSQPQPAGIFGAIHTSDDKRVASFVQRHPSLINITEALYDDSPLHCAAREDYLKVVRILLDAGSDVFVRNKFGQTALHVAAIEGNQDVCVLLVQRGAPMTLKDNAGNTPLDYANQKGFGDLLSTVASEISLQRREEECEICERTSFLRNAKELKLVEFDYADPLSYTYSGSISPELKCNSCHQPLLRPRIHQSCGSLFCHACIDRLMARYLSSSEDIAVSAESDCCFSKCPKCDKFICCSEIVVPDNIDDLNSQLSSLVVFCKWCRNAMPRAECVPHMWSNCLAYCPNGCGESVTLLNWSNLHRDSCPRRPRKCSASDCGCEYVSAHERMARHEADCIFVRLSKVLRHQRLRIASLEARVSELSGRPMTPIPQNGLFIKK